MDKQPVGQLPDLTQSNNDDEIMVITDSEHNQLKKEKISDFITDLTSTDENNAIVKGTDGKMFVTDFGNASNITEGTLPVSVLPDIPKDLLPAIETSDLPVSGVTADTYAYPSSVTVNAQGQVTAIEEGSPSGANANTDLSNLTETGESHFANPDLSNLTAEGEKHFLNKTQITNCILEAPNGIFRYSEEDSKIYPVDGLKVLMPIGRNNDKSIKNHEYTTKSSNNPYDLLSSYNFTGYLVIGTDYVGLVNIVDYYEVKSLEDRPTPNNYNYFLVYVEDEAKYFLCNRNNNYQEVQEVVLKDVKITLENGKIVSSTTGQPVELIKRTDPQIQAPYIKKTYQNGFSWYRIWSDGWVEQGGRISATAGTSTLTYLIEMANTTYNITSGSHTDGPTQYAIGFYNFTTTSCTYTTTGPIISTYDWVLCGYKA